MADDFYVFINCNIVPDKYGDWEVGLEEMAKYVWTSEPNTKGYYFGIPLDYAHDFSKTTSMLAFEIYGTRDDLYGPKGHLTSPAMAKFLEHLPAISTTGFDLSNYRLVSGFLDFPGDMTEAAIMQDVKITCNSASAREALLKSLASLVSSVEQQERRNGGKSGVLTYTAFASLDDEVGVRIYGRWRSREDMEKFVRREDVHNFWMGNKEHIRLMEQRGYLPNGKFSWLHR